MRECKCAQFNLSQWRLKTLVPAWLTQPYLRECKPFFADGTVFTKQVALIWCLGSTKNFSLAIQQVMTNRHQIGWSGLAVFFTGLFENYLTKVFSFSFLNVRHLSIFFLFMSTFNVFREGAKNHLHFPKVNYFKTKVCASFRSHEELLQQKFVNKLTD